MRLSATNPIAKFVAVSALAVLLGVVGWTGLVVTETLMSARASLALTEQNIEALEERINGNNVRGTGREPGLFLSLKAQDETLAGAELQDHLTRALAAHDVVPAFVEIRFPSSGEATPDGLRLVQLDTQFETNEGDLPAMMQALETGSPLAKLEKLSIDQANNRAGNQGGNEGWRTLLVAMTITAYWAPENAG